MAGIPYLVTGPTNFHPLLPAAQAAPTPQAAAVTGIPIKQWRNHLPCFLAAHRRNDSKLIPQPRHFIKYLFDIFRKIKKKKNHTSINYRVAFIFFMCFYPYLIKRN